MARENLRARLRSAPRVLKLSFSVVLLLGLALAVEGLSWAILRFGFQVDADARPLYRLRLSGWRVFEATPGVPLEPAIGGGPAVVPDALGLISGAPYAREKPAGTLRVVLTGGSVAAGAGQLAGVGFEPVRAYPRGTYTFERSIGGLLEAGLRAALPGRRVEVIVAAHNQKSALQSYVHYLTALASLSPDVLVHLEGWNDQGLLADREATPWESWERSWRDHFVRLSGPEAATGTHAQRLARLLAQRAEAAREDAMPPPDPPDAVAAVLDGARVEYDRVKVGLFFRPAAAWLRALEHHLAAVEADRVRVVFALQPMLSRARNKALSPTEAAWELQVRPRRGDPLESIHAWSLKRWLWDEHLTHELRRRVEGRGQVYLDLADTFAALPASVEAYTDFVHLTPEGNEAVARALVQAIVADLRR